MKAHIHDIVKIIVKDNPDSTSDETKDMIAFATGAYIRQLSKDIAEEYPDFGVDGVEEMVALVIKCLMAGVDAEKVFREIILREGFYFHS
ncbi:hypothetical protein DSCW_21430 [Desulfosarcina widdelii]|uniref:Uncharacterized protein n=1 Tax=Desulfosarcina widdelii TaxID=947919 RepID=A0A5K7YZ98_9BACT|nr:hypothetical protein [Desulfosarcina widdelii]BBO74726.1 hypothetical protein DSCW_21430 [Desulfosarcina widdelii]